MRLNRCCDSTAKQWVTRICCAQAQILQLMLRQRPWLGWSHFTPRSFHHLSARRGACMIRINSRVSYCQSSFLKPSSLSLICTVQEMKCIYYYVLWCVKAHHYIYAPWMALPTRRAVSFCWACVMSVPRAESNWLMYPGPLTFSLCEVWTAWPLQFIRLPNLMILDSWCIIEWIFSLHPCISISVTLPLGTRVYVCNL